MYITEAYQPCFAKRRRRPCGPVGPAVAAATVTLELGIDLGELERVVQLGAPYSASSFVQRLGRSGRRDDMASEMLFVCPEEEDEEAQLPARMPWTLLRAIAVIELYVKTKWVEPLEARKMPMGVLYHQTMSMLKSMGRQSHASSRMPFCLLHRSVRSGPISTRRS